MPECFQVPEKIHIPVLSSSRANSIHPGQKDYSFAEGTGNRHLITTCIHIKYNLKPFAHDLFGLCTSSPGQKHHLIHCKHLLQNLYWHTKYSVILGSRGNSLKQFTSATVHNSIFALSFSLFLIPHIAI